MIVPCQVQSKLANLHLRNWNTVKFGSALILVFLVGTRKLVVWGSAGVFSISESSASIVAGR